MSIFGKDDRVMCTLCGRVGTGAELTVWKVREHEHYACRRCHPYFKLRFADSSETAEDALEAILKQHGLIRLPGAAT